MLRHSNQRLCVLSCQNGLEILLVNLTFHVMMSRPLWIRLVKMPNIVVMLVMVKPLAHHIELRIGAMLHPRSSGRLQLVEELRERLAVLLRKPLAHLDDVLTLHYNREIIHTPHDLLRSRGPLGGQRRHAPELPRVAVVLPDPSDDDRLAILEQSFFYDWRGKHRVRVHKANVLTVCINVCLKHTKLLAVVPPHARRVFVELDAETPCLR
mmetsp:Transcript_60510/g.171936  ORF Transcript_60510/g.171936 Transcript_60510/m.171936 type:complete len:210 (-) Transcript_60510:383-1012(-)